MQHTIYQSSAANTQQKVAALSSIHYSSTKSSTEVLHAAQKWWRQLTKQIIVSASNNKIHRLLHAGLQYLIYISHSPLSNNANENICRLFT